MFDWFSRSLPLQAMLGNTNRAFIPPLTICLRYSTGLDDNLGWSFNPWPRRDCILLASSLYFLVVGLTEHEMVV